MAKDPAHISENDLAALLTAAGLTAQDRLTGLSEEEAVRLTHWLQEDAAHVRWQNELTDTAHLADLLAQYRALQPFTSAELEKFRQAHLQPRGEQVAPAAYRGHFTRKWKWNWAAAVLLIIGVGAYLWMQQKEKPETAIINPAPLKNDVLPGKDGAILTLADGSTVLLDSLGNGLIATQNGSNAVLKNGQLAYDPTGKGTAEILYNTMTTPKGRQFTVVLPDGTKVWLNAASSIHYPTVFSTVARKVEITGEVYFEVAQDSKHPFNVKVNDQVAIDVLGTHFNINAYENESTIKTTLLEGSVRIKNGHQQKILQPNEQAIISGTDLKVTKANTDESISWKNGLFNFNGADIKTVMRQLERWYDIQVKYEGDITEEKFKGELQRDLTLSQVMETLKDLDVKFRLDGRTLILE